MRPNFPGFPQEGIDFLRSVARNNRRDWFQPRKEQFEEQVRTPMRNLVECVNAAMSGFAPDYVTEPQQAIYRFYRDTRFSSDKKPYKDHTAASFWRRGMARHQGAGFYFEISPKKIGMGGGVYLTPPETLVALRKHLAEHHADFRKITRSRTLKRLYGEMWGESLTRVPKGYAPDHPAADLLRFKQFLFYIERPADIATTPALLGEILSHFRAIAPFIAFLDAPLLHTKKAVPEKELFF